MTKIINLIAGPGSGKSTIAADTFAKLKWHDVNAELATEWVKEAAWEDRKAVLEDQIFLFGQQHWRIHRLLGKVDVIVTDSPLILNVYYGRLHGVSESLINLIVEEHNKLNNINIFVERQKKYNPAGRWQDESGARQIDVGLKGVLDEFKIPYLSFPGTTDLSQRLAHMAAPLSIPKPNNTL